MPSRTDFSGGLTTRPFENMDLNTELRTADNVYWAKGLKPWGGAVPQFTIDDVLDVIGTVGGDGIAYSFFLLRAGDGGDPEQFEAQIWQWNHSEDVGNDNPQMVNGGFWEGLVESPDPAVRMTSSSHGIVAAGGNRWPVLLRRSGADGQYEVVTLDEIDTRVRSDLDVQVGATRSVVNAPDEDAQPMLGRTFVVPFYGQSESSELVPPEGKVRVWVSKQRSVVRVSRNL